LSKISLRLETGGDTSVFTLDAQTLMPRSLKAKFDEPYERDAYDAIAATLTALDALFAEFLAERFGGEAKA
jgi:hypothetical protein